MLVTKIIVTNFIFWIAAFLGLFILDYVHWYELGRYESESSGFTVYSIFLLFNSCVHVSRYNYGTHCFHFLLENNLGVCWSNFPKCPHQNGILGVCRGTYGILPSYLDPTSDAGIKYYLNPKK